MLNIFNNGYSLDLFRRNTRETCHVRGTGEEAMQEFENLVLSCGVYIKQLEDYVMSKKTAKERKEVLANLDKNNPLCVENLCSSINEFIQQDSNEFAFDFDPQSDKLTNISNATNGLRNSYCAMYKKKELNKARFVNKMKYLSSRIYALTDGKVASDGIINTTDIDAYFEDYGEFLLDCPELDDVDDEFFGPNFSFMSLRHGVFGDV